MLKKSFAPVAHVSSRVLILGSLPGDESLRQGRYYAYGRNAFWPLMGRLLGFDSALPYEDRLAALEAGGVALWDVISCGTRRGSLDSEIREERPNDIPGLLERCPGIRAICCNGTAAFRFLKRFFPVLFEGGLPVYQMPSTSPAAARLTFEQKYRVYEEVFVSLGLSK